MSALVRVRQSTVTMNPSSFPEAVTQTLPFMFSLAVMQINFSRNDVHKFKSIWRTLVPEERQLWIIFAIYIIGWPHFGPGNIF